MAREEQQVKIHNNVIIVVFAGHESWYVLQYWLLIIFY